MSTLKGATRKWVLVALETETSECILWPFAMNVRGYPIAQDTNGFYYPTRRICELTNGAPPSAKYHAAHSCGIRQCMNKNHIRWALPSENEQDKLLHGTYYGRQARFTEEQIREIRNDAKTPADITRIANTYNVTYQAIQKIVKRKSYSNIL